MHQEQSQECYNHHMLLKGQLEKITNFLFGSAENGTEISFTSKVALMFDVLTLIKRLLIGSVFTIIGAGIFIGQELQKIENNANILTTHIEYSKQLDARLTNVESELKIVMDNKYKNRN